MANKPPCSLGSLHKAHCSSCKIFMPNSFGSCNLTLSINEFKGTLSNSILVLSREVVYYPHCSRVGRTPLQEQFTLQGMMFTFFIPCLFGKLVSFWFVFHVNLQPGERRRKLMFHFQSWVGESALIFQFLCHGLPGFPWADLAAYWVSAGLHEQQMFTSFRVQLTDTHWMCLL